MARETLAEIRNSGGTLTGLVETTGDNGIKVKSMIGDPSEGRYTVIETKLESNLGKVSFGIERNDNSGIDDEMIVIEGRMDPGKVGGAVQIDIAPHRGATCESKFYIDSRNAVFYVPIQAPGLGSGDPFAAGVTSLYRELLFRDPEGDVVERVWRPSGLSLLQIRTAIIGSAEYKAKHS